MKEFQAGSQGAASFVIQRSNNSDVGKGNVSTLDAICGHSLYIAEQMLRQGVSVTFPLMEEERGTKGEAERKEEIALLLGTLVADSPSTLGADLLEATSLLESGATLYVFASVDDGSLVSALQRLRGRVSVVVLVYDAAAYDPKRLSDSATLFSEAYRQAGAHVVLMPEVAS